MIFKLVVEIEVYKLIYKYPNKYICDVPNIFNKKKRNVLHTIHVYCLHLDTYI